MSFQIGAVSKEWSEKSGIPVWYEPATTSTNDIAKDQVISADPITLYLTEHQTSGRGRGERTWSDPKDGGTFLSSWVFQMRNPPQPVMAPAVGLAIWTSVKATFPWLSLSLKAPNDLYLGERKLAGLLIENVQQGSHHRLIVGLGMNLWKSPADVPTATCLSSQLGMELTEDAWIQVLDRLLLEISLAVSQTKNALSPLQQKSLLQALNQFPLLSAPYDRVDADGSLWMNQQKIIWSEL